MFNRRYIKALRTATLGVFATLTLIWGAVDIVGVSAEALWEYVWLSIQGVLLVGIRLRHADGMQLPSLPVELWHMVLGMLELHELGQTS